MATTATILDLRRLISEMADAAPWTEIYLSDRLDAWAGTVNSLAAVIWREKAATYAELVDVKEGNSDRKLSQMYSQALKIADGLDGGGSSAAVRRPSRTRRIERV